MLNKDELNYLYQYACSLTNNDEQAYDFVHEAIIELQKYSPSNPRAYTKAIIRNLFYKKYKREKKHQQIDEIIHDDNLESIVLNRIQVNEVLNKINADERELLYEWAVEEKTIAQIAEEKGSKLGTILSKVSRLRKKILKLENNNE